MPSPTPRPRRWCLPMTLWILAVVAGLAGLVWASDRFVHGASALATGLGVSPLVVGLVVVGIGTSAPEMVVAAIAAGSYVLRVALSEHFTFRQGDAAYWIVMTSKTARDFPRFLAEGQDAAFVYSARDGTAPGWITMTYTSSDTLPDLDSNHRRYCRSQGFSAVPKDGLLLTTRLGCDAPDYRIEIEFRPAGDHNQVTVLFLER